MVALSGTENHALPRSLSPLYPHNNFLQKLSPQSPFTASIRNLPTTWVHDLPPHPPLHHQSPQSLPQEHRFSRATQSPYTNLPPISLLNSPEQRLVTTPTPPLPVSLTTLTWPTFPHNVSLHQRPPKSQIHSSHLISSHLHIILPPRSSPPTRPQISYPHPPHPFTHPFHHPSNPRPFTIRHPPHPFTIPSYVFRKDGLDCFGTRDGMG